MHIQAVEREERRRSERHFLSLDITLRAPGGFPKLAKLRSFSAGGCSITSAKLDEFGSRYWVRLPGLESQLATVNRTEAYETQLSFCHPLHPAVANAFAQAQRPQWQLGEWLEDRIRQLLEQRTETRELAPTGARVLVGGEPAKLENASPSGIEVTTPLWLRRGSVVSVSWGTSTAVAARVVRRTVVRLPYATSSTNSDECVFAVALGSNVGARGITVFGGEFSNRRSALFPQRQRTDSFRPIAARRGGPDLE